MKPHKSSILLAAALVSACTPASDTPPADPPHEKSKPRGAIFFAPLQLDLMTWNVAFSEFQARWDIPVPGSVTVRPGPNHSNLTDEDRAHKIADVILKADPDVVVNEVFSGEVRRRALLSQHVGVRGRRR